MAVYMGLSKAELLEERKVLRCGRNSGFTKGSQKLGWPCWLSKGNRMSTSYIPFFSPLSLSIDSFISCILISESFISFIFLSSGVHLSTSDPSSTPSPNSRASTPLHRIPLLKRLTFRNSSARSDRATKSSAHPSACVRGCRVPKSRRWRTKRIEWTKTRCRRGLPRALLYPCGRSIRMARRNL